MVQCKEAQIVNGTGTVLPVPFSQKANAVGIHWLRISFPKHHLADLTHWLSQMWGDFEQDGFGLWSYDSRFAWSNGASLNYDVDEERSQRVHLGSMTLDCPGGALDDTTAPDLQLLLEYCAQLGGKCTRIDVYFDDHERLVTFEQLKEATERHDYSGLIDFQIRQGGRLSQPGHTREEISFGKRGSRGNGKYLRWYNKELESGGEFTCDRWEVEFSQKKADIVFKKLAATAGDLDAFATLCGSLIAGCITFVHRTGDKNLSRLDRYEWWEQICKLLGGCVSIRVRRERDSLTGKLKWIERNVSPSLACLKKVFVSEDIFLRWLFDVLDDGAARMNRFSRRLAEDNEKLLLYEKGCLKNTMGVPYVCKMS